LRRIERSERRRNGAIPTIFSPESLLARLFLDSNLGGFLKFFRISLQNYQTKQPGCGRASEATTGGSGAREGATHTHLPCWGAPRKRKMEWGGDGRRAGASQKTRAERKGWAGGMGGGTPAQPGGRSVGRPSRTKGPARVRRQSGVARNNRGGGANRTGGSLSCSGGDIQLYFIFRIWRVRRGSWRAC